MSRRPMTDAEKQGRREWMRRAWADGRFRNRRKGMHPRHWTPAQNQELERLAGTCTVEEIADALERRFYIRRTTAGIRIQAKRLGISLWQGGLSMRDLSGLFGVDHRVIRREWVDAGYLAGRRWRGRGPNYGWWFEHADVERFIREHTWLVDLLRMPKGHRLTQLAETQLRADPWIVGTEALCPLLGISKTNVKRWILRGLIPYRRRPGAGRGGVLCFRGRDVPAMREAIAEARERSRIANVARFTAMRRARIVALREAS